MGRVEGASRKMHLNHKSKPTDVLAVEKIVENKYPQKLYGNIISKGEIDGNKSFCFVYVVHSHRFVIWSIKFMVSTET